MFLGEKKLNKHQLKDKIVFRITMWSALKALFVIFTHIRWWKKRLTFYLLYQNDLNKMRGISHKILYSSKYSVQRPTQGAQSPHGFQGVFRPQRVLSPPGKFKNVSPSGTNVCVRPLTKCWGLFLRVFLTINMWLIINKLRVNFKTINFKYKHGKTKPI